MKIVHQILQIKFKHHSFYVETFSRQNFNTLKKLFQNLFTKSQNWKVWLSQFKKFNREKFMRYRNCTKK